MPLNKKLTVALKPADSGIFDIVLDGQLIFSRKQEGRFPTVDEIKKQIEPKLSIPKPIWRQHRIARRFTQALDLISSQSSSSQ